MSKRGPERPLPEGHLTMELPPDWFVCTVRRTKGKDAELFVLWLVLPKVEVTHILPFLQGCVNIYIYIYILCTIYT